jgi:hypothetical protein
MNALEVSQRAIDAWNRHDADAILALYAGGGTYSAPRAGGALTEHAEPLDGVTTRKCNCEGVFKATVTTSELRLEGKNI